MTAIRIFADSEAVSRAAAEEIVHLAGVAIAARGRFVLALAGGSTPRRTYELLGSRPYQARLDWTRVELFWGDERPVAPEDPDSNFGMAHGAMLRNLSLRPEQVHRIEGERPDRQAVASDYEKEIARVLGAQPGGPPPAFDLILLGMGPDGHTASLFPNTAALGHTSRWVVANQVPQLEAERITFTLPLIHASREIRVITAGPEKATALAAVLEGPRQPLSYPSQLLEGGAANLVWLVDRGAASRLREVGRDAKSQAAVTSA